MKTVLVLFGGQSTEHDISCISAEAVIRAIDPAKYRTVLTGITKQGRWVYVDDVSQIANGEWRNGPVQAVLSPDAEEHSLYLLKDGQIAEKIRIDIAFPVLHGLNGEDGTVQGIFELMKIPYVGAGVLASAVSMDKLFTKTIVHALGIRQAEFVGILRSELQDMDDVVRRVEERLKYPVFVKPSCAGSSVGVTKALDREALTAAILEASRHDYKILVEETITGRELECAVYFSGSEMKVSGVGEILAAAEFYDFDAKYNNEDSRTDTSPFLPDGVEEEIRQDAAAVFRAVDAYGLSRVDFFLDEKGVVFNEINTMPGFTPISMYPMLFEKQGISMNLLVDMLLDSARGRAERILEDVL